MSRIAIFFGKRGFMNMSSEKCIQKELMEIIDYYLYVIERV